MSKDNYTSGPWKWDKHGNLRGKGGNAVINPNLRGDVLSGVNRESDSLLIAAAPHLLEALRLAIAALELLGHDTAKLRTAIAEATGTAGR